jgi:hypothetical protein
MKLNEEKYLVLCCSLTPLFVSSYTLYSISISVAQLKSSAIWICRTLTNPAFMPYPRAGEIDDANFT